MRLGYNLTEHATGVRANGFLGVGIQERDEEEWHVVLPGYPAISSEVDGRDKVTVTVRFV